jgi:outer membrane PBP1 activator LpoA protein
MVLAIVAAGVLAGCGTASTSPDKVEVQLERQLADKPQFVECDRSSDQPNRRYSCRVETSADRVRYVATCPSPGQPCVLRRTADAGK